LPGRGGADRAEDAGANHSADCEHHEIAGAKDALERPRRVRFVDEQIGNRLALEELAHVRAGILLRDAADPARGKIASEEHRNGDHTSRQERNAQPHRE
jgi:hypothetical protein